MPKRNVPVHSSGKLAVRIAAVVVTEPASPNDAPTKKPLRRPMRFMRSGAWQKASSRTFIMRGMIYRRLGKSGLKVSELSLGSWVTYGNQLDAKGARECMAAAWDRGVNFFDNAQVYAAGKSEEIMG